MQALTLLFSFDHETLDEPGMIAARLNAARATILNRAHQAPAIQWVSAIELGPRLRDPRPKTLEKACLAGLARDEMEHVNGPALADAIDTANPLLEPHRIPGQLEVDHGPAAVLEIEPFACGIGCKEDGAAALVKRLERGSACVPGKPSVDDRARSGPVALDMDEGVAVLREHDCRLPVADEAVEQPHQPHDFGLSPGSGIGRVLDCEKHLSLSIDIVQKPCGDEGCLVGCVQVAEIVDWQRELASGVDRRGG